MPTLADWLLEQITEDERVAREAAVAADGQRWGHPTDRYTVQVHVLDAPTVRPATEEEDAWFPALVYDEGACPDDAGEHIARWDPTRVLAECDAKRRIIDVCGMPDPHTWEELAEAACPECETLFLLAAPYADREGYRPEWAPRG